MDNSLSYHFGHADGHTSTCYSTDGRWILTCGSDGDVRVWSGQEDEDADSHCAGETAYALAFGKDRFYVAIDNGLVQIFTFPECKRDGIVCRFSAPVTHIAVNKLGTKIAAGSCDMDIRVVDMDKSGEIMKMTGHTAPVTGVEFDPLDIYLASSSCDGSVKIWDLTTGSLVKSLPDLLPKSNDFFRAVVLGRPSWHENLLAIPNGRRVTLYERESWTESFFLEDSSVISALSLVAFSPCGRYLAASSTSGELIIWNVKSRMKISYYSHGEKSAISGFAWHPDNDSLTLCNRRGQYGLLSNVISNAVSEEAVNLPGDNASIDGGNSDNENEISIEKIKRGHDLGLDSDADDASSRIKDDEDSSSEVAFRPLNASLSMQPAFQPSSTPVHFQHRFMLWNSIGVVRCFNTDEEKSIDLEFHNSNFHHSLHINNYDDYTMAALSKKVFASATKGSDDVPSKLTCVLLNAWDGTKEWSTTMPEGESIVAVAASGNWVAVVTDFLHLRIFSFAGTQRQPLSIPGPAVTICGQEEKLCVIFHQGIGATECQNLGVTVFDVSSVVMRTRVPPQPLPLSPRACLKWMGFSDEGRLCAFDSSGVMRALSHDNLHWGVIADTRLQVKGPSDHYFVIGVSEKFQNIRCILCKGSYYPMTIPRPNIVEIPLKLPMCDPESEKSTLEESFWRLMSCLPGIDALSRTDEDYLSDVAEMEKTLKQTIIKLFANACKANIDIRATDVASFMPDQTMEMAAKYASKSGKLYLSEKLAAIEPADWAQACNDSQAFYAVPKFQVPFSSNGRLSPELRVESQRDMFDDNTPSENSKLLLAERESEDISVYSDTAISTISVNRNPFITKAKGANEPKGLSFFDRPVPPKAPKSLPPSVVTTKKKVSRPKNVSNEGEISRKKQTFVDWFNEHKTKLQEENPTADAADLTKLGMKKFRDFIKNSEEKTDNSTVDSQTSAVQKRKVDDCDSLHIFENVKKVASSKLSEFAFNRK